MLPGLLLVISMWGGTANAAQSAITCDRIWRRRKWCSTSRDGRPGVYRHRKPRP